MNRHQESSTTLRELCFLFLKLGTTAFGGPAAHIAMMREEVVQRRKWLSEEEFLSYLGATQLIPGPNSTELAIHIGHHRKGFPGLIVAGMSFILPAMLIVWAIAWTYTTYGSLPQVSNILYGIKPVVIAVVLQALWALTHSAVKSFRLGILGLLALGLNAAGTDEIAVIFVIGTLSFLVNKNKPGTPLVAAGLVTSVANKVFATMATISAVEAAPVLLSQLFLIFLKIGSVLFGSGYVLLAFLRAEFVEKLHWITETQLLDAVAVGQFTPGPVFTTATFLGYIIAGNSGALLATLGIFFPAFFFVAISAPLIPRIRRSGRARAFLDGVTVASLALMAVVAWQLGRSALVDIPAILLAITAAFFLIRFKINSAWLVLGGGLIGALIS